MHNIAGVGDVCLRAPFSRSFVDFHEKVRVALLWKVGLSENVSDDSWRIW